MGHQNEAKEIFRISNNARQSHGHSGSPLPDVVVKADVSQLPTPQLHEETFFSIGLQVLLPFLVAGMGMVGAGIYLDHVQVWPILSEIFDAFSLIQLLKKSKRIRFFF